MVKSLHLLVTGSAGRISRAMVRDLKARGHFIRGFDLVATPGADESVVSDLADAATAHRAASNHLSPVTRTTVRPGGLLSGTKKSLYQFARPREIVRAEEIVRPTRESDVRYSSG
jgi:nucleoside-diphosphate-sugar epimerase